MQILEFFFFFPTEGCLAANESFNHFIAGSLYEISVRIMHVIQYLGGFVNCYSDNKFCWANRAVYFYRRMGGKNT